jgi:hypothetical protein
MPNLQKLCSRTLKDGLPGPITSSTLVPRAAELWPPTLSAARKQRQFLRANDPSVRSVKHLQRGEIPKISHPLLSVETAGIEPASAVA